mgnify:CR=1 FL=1
MGILFCLMALVLGLSGCAFNPLSTFTTPTIDQIEYETVTPAVSDDALVTPGTLTVALDTSDAPQAMQGADGELTGYAVDAARALASRMGLKVRPRQVPRSATKRLISLSARSTPRTGTLARSAPACTMPLPCSVKPAMVGR